MHLVATKGPLKIIEALAKHPKIILNIINANGKIALILASKEGHLKVVKLLLKQIRYCNY